MPKYFYTATSLKGETKTGVLEAEDEHELARILRKEKYVLVSASLEKSKRGLKIFQSLIGVSLKEKLFFTRNLRLMIKAGVSLPRALKILANQTENKNFQKVLNKIKEEITKGKKLSEALRDWPKVFSELFCSMVETGEETGNLEEVLKNLARQMERTYELKVCS